ncbi:MAG TPA: hypothetical protein VJ870_10370 [Amycolatopsis sp.]|nr:hypothetical protein [Amycolatopsis sp.]
MGEREHRQHQGSRTDLADEPTPIYQAVAEAIRRVGTDGDREEVAARS